MYINKEMSEINLVFIIKYKSVCKEVEDFLQNRNL
jgi:hypothetical protein